MANCWHHAESSAKKFGGKPEDYYKLHLWFDESKAGFAHFTHRALRHHSEGIFWLEETFGPTVTNSNGKLIPTRLIGEQHVKEDCGFIPCIKDWLIQMKPVPWMMRGYPLNTEKENTSGSVPHSRQSDEA